MIRGLRFALLAGASLALAACSKGPSDDDVAAALKARLGEPGMGGASLGLSTGAVDHVHCYPRDGGKYTCSFEVQMDMMGRSMKNTGQLLMVKSGETWTYDKDQALTLRASQ
jgi:hypothetical protein